jgi:hypothetical protein
MKEIFVEALPITIWAINRSSLEAKILRNSIILLPI